MKKSTDQEFSASDEQERTTEFLVALSPFPILKIQSDTGLILFANPAFYEQYGFEKENTTLAYQHLVSKKFKMGSGPSHRKNTLGQDGLRIHYSPSEPEFKVQEKWIPWPGESPNWMLHLQPFLPEAGTKEQLKEDERIRAREELKTEKLLLQTLIDNLPDRIYFKDRKSKFIFANQAVANHIGVRDASELQGKSDASFYPAEHAARYYSDEQRIMLTGNPLINYEEPARNPDQSIGWTLSSKIPIKNQEGEVIGLVGISRDITGIKQNQADLLQAKEKAEQSNRLKDSFIANVSHEIRTPLNAILGFSALMRDEYEETGTIGSLDYFAIVETSGERLMRTIEMILNLSRIETGEYAVLPRKLDLKAIIGRLQMDYLLAAKKKNLDMNFEMQSSRETIYCDEYAFEHALSNLIDNAIKYTHQGFVKVRFSDTSDQQLQIEVQDSGIGISKEYLPYLFEPYSQEEDGYARTFEGIGLGLSLTHKLLKLINGKIAVQSQKGVGSTFTLTLRDQPESGDQ